MIKTSIIVPVYNTAGYLTECFNSIFNQTQKEIEVIAIDDGSTDNSLSILEDFKKKHPEMIVVSQKNEGPGSARNKGIELAKGEFIYFMDSDDCLINTAMEICYHYVKSNQLDLIMFDAETFGDVKHNKDQYNRKDIITDKGIVFSGEEFADKYWVEAFRVSPCLFYTSSQFIKKHDLRFLQWFYYEDNEFYCKMMSLAKRVMYIPKILYRRRYRMASIMTSPFDMSHARRYLQMIQVIDRERYSNKMQAAMQRVKCRFLKILLGNCLAGNFLNDQQFAEDFYRTALDIYGNDINNINLYSNIHVLYQLSKGVSDEVVSGETRVIIQNRKTEILQKMFEKIPLRSEGKYIGIYGTGKTTDLFISEYENNIGKIEANLIFIDSRTTSGEKKYGEYEIMNVNDIGELPLECIIVSSSKYEEEIYRTIREKYRDKFKVVLLTEDLKFS